MYKIDPKFEMFGHHLTLVFESRTNDRRLQIVDFVKLSSRYK